MKWDIDSIVGALSKKISGVLLLFVFCNAYAQSYDERVETYISQYSEWAIEEMQRVGIPASITLAQGIIESNAGLSSLATEANNHFGIKCHNDWQGDGYNYDDDRKNECFRKYPSALDSYKDHSDFLRNKSRYAVLFTYDPIDYKAWAKGLKACGYATNPQYANVLIKCIDDYDLHQWDMKEDDRAAWFASMNRSELKPVIKENGNPEIVNNTLISLNAEERVYVFNDIRCVALQDGESLNDLATTYQIGMKRLMRYNDITDPAQLQTGDRVYLQPKRRNGDTSVHTVKEGETMFTISMQHGIQLQVLYEKNKMQLGTQPATGEAISLKETRDSIPALANKKIDLAEKKPVAPAVEIEIPKVHTVSKGDTLYSISRKYNLTINELKSMNKLRSDEIRPGEKLMIAK